MTFPAGRIVLTRQATRRRPSGAVPGPGARSAGASGRPWTAETSSGTVISDAGRPRAAVAVLVRRHVRIFGSVRSLRDHRGRGAAARFEGPREAIAQDAAALGPADRDVPGDLAVPAARAQRQQPRSRSASSWRRCTPDKDEPHVESVTIKDREYTFRRQRPERARRARPRRSRIGPDAERRAHQGPASTTRRRKVTFEKEDTLALLVERARHAPADALPPASCSSSSCASSRRAAARR